MIKWGIRVLKFKQRNLKLRNIIMLLNQYGTIQRYFKRSRKLYNLIPPTKNAIPTRFNWIPRYFFRHFAKLSYIVCEQKRRGGFKSKKHCRELYEGLVSIGFSRCSTFWFGLCNRSSFGSKYQGNVFINYYFNNYNYVILNFKN